MKGYTYLEVTYRQGKPLAAYLHLPGRRSDRAARSRKAAPGLVVDYAEDGRAIGIEITSPKSVTLEAVNSILAELHQQALAEEELSPLMAG
ncbi:MAG TPA: DUF2283 domain-containing protein [Phycisphaerae bacterium]|nr:DUF2283 domain-containing protein [Phycisphaerae bacterium]